MQIPKHIPITDWAADDQPREKAMMKGVDVLSDAELVAILLGSGTKNKSALQLAQEVLNNCNKNIDELAKKTIDELCKSTKGIGPAKATTILAAIELGKRKSSAIATIKNSYQTSKEMANLIRPYFEDKIIEEFYVIGLSAGGQLCGIKKLSTGGMSSTIVDVKILLKLVLEMNASRLVIAHNHPGGSTTPSTHDVAITQKIKAACIVMDILLTDHIIITHNSYYSFADNANL
jgi:DNA repair protein RadC